MATIKLLFVALNLPLLILTAPHPPQLKHYAVIHTPSNISNLFLTFLRKRHCFLRNTVIKLIFLRMIQLRLG